MSFVASPSVNSDGLRVASVLVFGEVLFDCFPDGKRVCGGAPFNVAWGLRGFGHAPVFISSVGDDADGEVIRAKMDEWGMGREGLQTDASHPTGVVQVTLKDGEPNYEISENRAWDFIEDEGWAGTDLIYHGSLALRSESSRKSFQAIMDRSGAKRFFDVNLRAPYDSMDRIKLWLRGADWVKLNIDELQRVLGDPSIAFEGSDDALGRLRDTYGIGNVLLTAGSEGARILGQVGDRTCTPAPTPENFVDTVGAGDSFSAFTIHGLLSGMPVGQIVEQASRFAAKVCGIQGATQSEISFYQ